MTSPISSFTNAIDTPISSATNFIISGSGISSIQTIDSTYSYIYISSGTITLNVRKPIIVDLLLVGGGGGGGISLGSGGGGGGVVYIPNHFLNAGTYTITVGAGGSPMATTGDNTTGNGGNSTITYNSVNIITALGGAIGNGQSSGRATQSGGSGAGGVRNYSASGNATQKTNSTISDISRSFGYGNNGGIGNNSSPYQSGGGGGAGSAGNNFSTNKSGDGGNGIQLNITGVLTYYAGGGGGGQWEGLGTSYLAGSGGLGGGGNGSYGDTSATSGTANTGGGGGGRGGTTSGSGGSGGSGVVIIKFMTIENIIDGIKELRFNTSGTVIFNTPTICDVLLVGGGGGGSGGIGNGGRGGSGGGGGGVGIGKILFKENITYTITIGSGGDIETIGNNTSISGDIINEIAYGGGTGRNTIEGADSIINDGGSGGGGGSFGGGKATMGLSSSTNNTSIIYYGNQGGYLSTTGGGAGGGGAMNKGNDSSNNNGANGGNGILWYINNTSYGGGGGGGTSGAGGTSGVGGSGGGGNGGASTIGIVGTPNTGGGGGGGSGGTSGGLGLQGRGGGSGIVIIQYSTVIFNNVRNSSVYLSYLRNILGLSGEYRISNFKNRITNIGSSQINLSSYLTSKNTRGLTILNPGKNALDIKNNTGVTVDGSYYIMCNNIPTLIYCLMDNKYDGGGWMMLMKMTNGTTFEFGANYWTTANTLNSTDLTRNNADAKYESYNSIPIKDVMGIWPVADFGYTGGSFTITDGWTWLVNNWYYNNGYVKAIDGFQRARDANPSNPYNFAGMKTGVFSTQSPAYRHVFGGHSHIGNNNWGTVRWGFVWNENGSSDFNSCDAWNGIGLSRSFYSGFGISGKSAGDSYGCCGTAGYNREMRVELYGR